MSGADPVQAAVAALRGGQAVVLPTDTVYGLCADAYRQGPVRRLSRLKGRSEEQPIALLGAELDAILDAVPELRGRAAVTARALLPGPYTLVLPNPARRFRWLTGGSPETIGIRVPNLSGPARSVVERVGVVAATSANLHGGPDPTSVGEIPAEIRAAAAAVVDAGPLAGTASTVLDLTADEPVVLRQGAVPADEALSAVARARAPRRA